MISKNESHKLLIALITLIYTFATPVETQSRSLDDCGNVQTISASDVGAASFIISQPGKYCVKDDLFYTGNSAAIIIEADNVTIDFNNHDLILNDSSAIGIGSVGHRELIIKHDRISTLAPSSMPGSVAITLENCAKVTIENCLCSNTYYGIFLNTCHDVIITDCRFTNNGAGSIGAINSSDLTFSRLSTNGSSIGVFLADSNNCQIDQLDAQNCGSTVYLFSFDNVTFCNNCHISNISSTNQSGQDLITGNNILFENITTTSIAPAVFSIIALGLLSQSGANIPANNVIIRNCSATYLVPATGFVLSILVGDNILVEDSAFSGGFVTVTIGGADTLLNLQGTVSNTTLRNCVIDGQHESLAVVWVPSLTENIVLESCIMENSPGTIVILGPSGSNTLIKNCTIRNGDFGCIATGDFTTNVTIVGNTIANVSNPNAGGVNIAPGAQNIICLDNIFYNVGQISVLSQGGEILDINSTSTTL